MNVCVMGLGHLGTVTAACLASRGHDVVALDSDTAVVGHLRLGRASVFEPELDPLIQAGLASNRLRFTSDAADALARAQVVWIAYDTPVDEADRGDVAFVLDRAGRLFPHLRAGTTVLISSQVPVGTTRRIERAYASARSDVPVGFGYSPENLRLGQAITTFLNPDRVIVGLRHASDRPTISELLRPVTDRIEWMSVESAEMTKHALNAFLATSVAFMNEIAMLCEESGADAKDVERGLKSETRIGPRAYLAPGAAFAGGTLARDLRYLIGVRQCTGLALHLLPAVLVSNDAHKHWSRRKLRHLLGELAGKRIAIWGLTYKPGTNTLRRSGAVELCEWLVGQGALVQAHDPAVRTLPEPMAHRVTLHVRALEAVDGAVALVIATEWPEYRSVTAQEIIAVMRRPVVLDPNRFLAQALAGDARIRYVTVGLPA